LPDCSYKNEWYKRVLLKRKEPVDLKKEKLETFSSYGVGIEGQIYFNDQIFKEFYYFRLVEIVSDTEVVEHMRFSHPVNIGQV
jgi:hypothetical protein